MEIETNAREPLSRPLQLAVLPSLGLDEREGEREKEKFSIMFFHDQCVLPSRAFAASLTTIAVVYYARKRIAVWESS